MYFRVFNINVRSVYHLTMLAVPHLIETKGNIINVSSIAGIRSFPGVLAYCMSKSTVDQFICCFALESILKQIRTNYAEMSNMFIYYYYHMLPYILLYDRILYYCFQNIPGACEYYKSWCHYNELSS